LPPPLLTRLMPLISAEAYAAVGAFLAATIDGCAGDVPNAPKSAADWLWDAVFGQVEQ